MRCRAVRGSVGWVGGEGGGWLDCYGTVCSACTELPPAPPPHPPTPLRHTAGEYSEAFVSEFRTFTAELRDFFNAGSLTGAVLWL